MTSSFGLIINVYIVLLNSNQESVVCKSYIVLSTNSDLQLLKSYKIADLGLKIDRKRVELKVVH